MTSIDRLKQGIIELIETTDDKETLFFIWEFLISE